MTAGTHQESMFAAITGLIAGAAADPVAALDGRSRASGADDRELLACAAIAVGTAVHAIVLARRRAGSRRVAGRPLIEFQSTGHRLARVAADIAMARISVTELAAQPVPERHRVLAATAAACEAALAAAAVLVQTYGAAGTSDDAPVRAFAACHTAGTAAGSPGALWAEAGRLRGLGTAEGDADDCP